MTDWTNDMKCHSQRCSELQGVVMAGAARISALKRSKEELDARIAELDGQLNSAEISEAAWEKHSNALEARIEKAIQELSANSEHSVGIRRRDDIIERILRGEG